MSNGNHFPNPPSARSGKILPPFVKDGSAGDNDRPDLDHSHNGVELRQLWKRVAIQHFNNDCGDPNDPDDHGDRIDYEISDDMIRAYSKQYRELKEMIDEHVKKKMKTWHQLAVLEGQKTGGPSPDQSYFLSEWLVTPVRHGPVRNSCGCGCGCG